jgi:hypothetical protein
MMPKVYLKKLIFSGQKLFNRNYRWAFEDEGRFLMLETIREFALELLSNSSEKDFIKGCHADYYLSLVTEAEIT